MCLLASLFAATLLTTAAMAQDTRVVLLGTGTPNPTPDRSGPAVAIRSGNRVYIVDCGPGVVRRAVQAGIEMEQLTLAYITHLHSDHTLGLPDLIFTPAVTGRLQGLDLYGPPGLRAMTSHLMKAYAEDQQVRLHGLEPAVPKAYVVRAHEVKPGEIYSDPAMRVTAFRVNHGSWKYAFGYRFDAPDKSIVVSGDTTYSPGLIDAARNCDILVHEVYSAKGLEGRTADWQRYHRAFHTSGYDVGRLAAQVRPKTLVLYHQLPMEQTPEEIVEEVKQQFQGTVVFGKDLDIVR